MEMYIGTKVIKATEMTKGEYNEYRGWQIPEDENPDNPGYLVEYLDGGESNHPDHENYISWSPADVFEDAYQSDGELSFGHALEMLKAGKKVARSGWNGKGMWLILVPGSPNIRLVAGTPYSNAGITEPTNINPHIDMFTADGDMQPGWLASQTDMLANDWCVV